MSRKLKDGILKAFLAYTKATEIPAVYSLWCGISTVSAVLGRDVFLDMGHYTVYPNMYIVLVAGSGKCKKSTSISVAEKFISKVRPKVQTFCQKGTPEALIANLAGVNADEEENTLRACAEGILIADELATLIDKNSSQNGLIQLLTTLWDAKDSFIYETRGRGKERIDNSCVSLLGGSTIAWIKESIGLSAIAGGFTARIIFVYQDKPERFVLRTHQDPTIKVLGDNIVHDLCEIAKLRGAFCPEPEAWTMLEEEYVNFMQTNPMHENKYLSGYANKRTSNLLKLCMVMSASKRDDRIVTVQDASEALRVLKHVEQFMPTVMMAIAEEDSGVNNNYIAEIVKAKKVIDRKMLLNLVHHKLSAAQMDEALNTLEQAGIVSRQLDGRGDTIRYLGTHEEKQQLKKESFTEMVLKGEFGT
jgi:hypothetical protein